MLKPGKYRAYGLSDSLLGASIEVLTPQESSTCIIKTPLLARVKMEPGLQTILEFIDDSDSELLPVSKFDLDHSCNCVCGNQGVAPRSENDCCQSTSKSIPQAYSIDSISVVKSLKKLAARKRLKKVMSGIDFTTV